MSSERQSGEPHMIKTAEGMEKQQLSGPEPATSRSIADPLAANPWSLPASTNPFLFVSSLRMQHGTWSSLTSSPSLKVTHLAHNTVVLVGDCCIQRMCCSSSIERPFIFHSHLWAVYFCIVLCVGVGVGGCVWLCVCGGVWVCMCVCMCVLCVCMCCVCVCVCVCACVCRAAEDDQGE